MSDFKYSLAIPVDLNLRPRDILKKAADIIKRASNSVEIVFGHNERNSKFDAKLKELGVNRPNVKFASGAFYDKLVCQSLLRNRALELCTCDFVYIMDVDCFFDEVVADFCINELKSGLKKFVFLPCIYLSPKGSRKFATLLDNGENARELMFENYINFQKHLCESLALPSATIFLRRQDFHAINGFDENFVGRGGEDFDFMLRLALFHNALDKTPDLMDNVFYKAPLLSEGFRKYLSIFCLPYFFDKMVSFHNHHGRNRLKGYFRRYKTNANLLASKFKFEPSELKAQGKNLLALYDELCFKHKISPAKYAILFDTRRPKILSLERLILFLRRL